MINTCFCKTEKKTTNMINICYCKIEKNNKHDNICCCKTEKKPNIITFVNVKLKKT